MSISSKVFITYLVCGTGLAALRLMPFLLLKKIQPAQGSGRISGIRANRHHDHPLVQQLVYG